MSRNAAPTSRCWCSTATAGRSAAGARARWPSRTTSTPRPTARILVADRDAHQVLRFDKDGKVVQALGKRHWPSLDAPFNHPTAAAQAPDGEIYVADGYGNSSVHRFAADGSLIRTWGGQGSGPGAFTTPHAIAVDSRGRVLVADRENNRVQVFDREGNFVAEWGDFYHPMQIWIDDRDLVFVTDQIPRISLLTLDGKLVGRCRGAINGAHGLSRRRRRQPLSLRAAAAGSDQARAAQLTAVARPERARGVRASTADGAGSSRAQLDGCASRPPTTEERPGRPRSRTDRSPHIGNPGAADLDAAHQAAERAGVAERDVLGAAVVPEGDRALLPAEAEGEFRPVAVLEQEVEQRLALGLGHALDADRVGRVDEQASCGRSRDGCARSDGCCASRASPSSSRYLVERPLVPAGLRARPCRCRCARRAARRAASSCRRDSAS